MAKRILTKVVLLNYPRQQVFAVLANVEHWSFWNPHIYSVVVEGAMRVGTRGFVTSIKRSYTRFTVTVFNPGRHIELKFDLVLGSLFIAYELSDDGEKTLLKRTTRFSGPVGAFFYWRWSKWYSKVMDETLAALANELALS